MKCPFCHSEDNRIIDTRKFDTCVIRVRLCLNCKMGWHTEEVCGVTQIEKLVERHVKIQIRT
jgi:transcriptional regulator NrdR family protein